MTLAESRLTVLAMTAPHPSRNAREMTFKLVPGGPDATTNGFGSFSPSTVVASVGIVSPLSCNRTGLTVKLRDKFRAAGSFATSQCIVSAAIAWPQRHPPNEALQFSFCRL